MRNMSLRPQVSGLGWFGGLAMVLAAGLSGCGPGHGTDCLKSTGTVVTQRREITSGLVTVTAFDNVDLRLIQDTQTYAEVRTGENLQDDITLTRHGNTLEINNTSTCNWARSYDTPREVTLHLPASPACFCGGRAMAAPWAGSCRTQSFSTSWGPAITT